mmetsp:Transcript_17543/g.40146  ORF Transcript_17543/g.40146 Transcript_17543/m.40146 type:complete len:253 (+) Transcript_17543:740-1498(+)
MSRPRDATSVATRSGVAPFLKLRSVSCRSACVRSPWIASTRCGVRSVSLRASSSDALLVETKMSTVPCLTKCGSRASSQLHLNSTFSKTSTTCVMSSFASPACPTDTRTGSVSTSRASRSRFGLNVAEKRSVCLSGRTCASSERTCASKPSENILSASSSTTYVIRIALMPPFMRISSMSRPGVPTATSAPAFSSRNCSCLPTPPKAPMQRSPKPLANLRASITICSTSSCVGAITRPMGPSPLLSSGWSIT